MQTAFPEVRDGEYSNLLRWAADSGVTEVEVMGPYADWYRETSRRIQETNNLKSELWNLQEELLTIHQSFGYMLMQFCAPRINRLLPEGTRRGEFRKVVVASLRIALQDGISTLIGEAMEKIGRRELRVVGYAPPLIAKVDTSTTWSAIREEYSKLKLKPTFSIIMPVFNTRPEHLSASIESVMKQAYPNWELCVCDNGSTDPSIKKILQHYSIRNPKIRVTTLTNNQGIAGGTNAALALASGEFIGLLDSDDELTVDAIFEVVKAVNNDPNVDMIYSDEAKIDSAGQYVKPFYKPDFSLHLLRSQNYLVHMAVIRRRIVVDVNGFESEFDGAQDYDLFFRVLEKTRSVHHVRKILYLWRETVHSGAKNALAKPWIYDRGKRAVQEHLTRLGYKAKVEMGEAWGLYRVSYQIEGDPVVDILIPTRKILQMKECLTCLFENTTWKNYRVFAIINGKQDYEVVEIKSKKCMELDTSTDPKTGLIGPAIPYNWSRMNNRAMSVTSAPYVVFLNDDTRIISGDWLQNMLQYAQLREVGAVGALLLFPDNVIQHAGDYITESGTGDHCFEGMYSNSFEVNGLAQSIRETSAVTSACMMVRRTVLEEQQGFDEELRNFDDYDFCLRLREKGYEVIYTPYARVYHLEGPTRPQIRDKLTLRRLVEKHPWARSDPFYRYEYRAMYHVHSVRSRACSM